MKSQCSGEQPNGLDGNCRLQSYEPYHVRVSHKNIRHAHDVVYDFLFWPIYLLDDDSQELKFVLESHVEVPSWLIKGYLDFWMIIAFITSCSSKFILNKHGKSHFWELAQRVQTRTWHDYARALYTRYCPTGRRKEAHLKQQTDDDNDFAFHTKKYQ